eukprot:maker-scaffold91_size383040-snap-gene-1.32 protein:Tk03179 transcript:maker-scaffold91_size383040-snap-gene-1.32-mRNA-1 annotation:"hypothetical protein DAPPUDRAFT_194537"
MLTRTLIGIWLGIGMTWGQESLPSLNVDPNTITVSGISSGAYFATQFHVAHSMAIRGCGMWAGGPDLCFSRHGILCMNTPSVVLVDVLTLDTETLGVLGRIDDPFHLENDRVYIFHGTEDSTVPISSATKLERYYRHFLQDPDSQMKLKNDIPASHSVVSDHVGTPCGVEDKYYIQNCGYNSVFEMLNHLIGNLAPPKEPGTMAGALTQFSQAEFFDGNPNKASMEEFGFIYIPPNCKADSGVQCRFHIFFHGCAMQHEEIGTEFIRTAGFIEVADANDIILLFPQTIAKTLTGNPYGCWNWFGYLNDLLFEEYATKNAKQIEGIYKMLTTPLPALNVDQSWITVSGISAGAYFATQFHVAYSEVIQGCGMWAGGPNLCYARDALLCMNTPLIINVSLLTSDTDKIADMGDIDPTANMANDRALDQFCTTFRVYIFHGTKDTTVFPASAEKTESYYAHYLNNTQEQLVLNNEMGASHAVVSDHFGSSCGKSDHKLYIENCDFNSVYQVLNHITGGSLFPPVEPGMYQGNLTEIDQAEFFDGKPGSASMDETGYLYIPPECGNLMVPCKFHIFFHGCSMYAQSIGTDFITNSGFLELADANHLIILFPQTVPKMLSGNPAGCFNWFGYLDDLLFEDFAKKDAKQMKGIYDMMARVTGI